MDKINADKSTEDSIYHDTASLRSARVRNSVLPCTEKKEVINNEINS